MTDLLKAAREGRTMFAGMPDDRFRIAVGQRVELHPGLDDWMRGDRYGTVVKLGTKLVHVKLDRSGRVRRLPADRLAWVA